MDHKNIFHFVGTKGGVGTSLTAGLTAAMLMRAKKKVLLIDATATNDVFHALGIAVQLDPNDHAIQRYDDTLYVCNYSTPNHSFNIDSFNQYLNAYETLFDYVVVDHGTNIDVVDGHVVVVSRNCYLALRRYVSYMQNAAEAGTSIAHLVVLEPGRALSFTDCQAVFGSSHDMYSVELDPSIARASDAGLLIYRMPISVRKVIETYLQARNVNLHEVEQSLGEAH